MRLSTIEIVYFQGTSGARIPLEPFLENVKSALKELVLFFCRIGTLEKNFLNGFEKLQLLILAYSDISDIHITAFETGTPYALGHPSIEHISLASNELSSFNLSILEHLAHSLSYLDLGYQRPGLRSLYRTTQFKLSKLTQLKLSGNLLTSMSSEILDTLNVSNSTKIELDDNAFCSAEQGTTCSCCSTAEFVRWAHQIARVPGDQIPSVVFTCGGGPSESYFINAGAQVLPPLEHYECCTVPESDEYCPANPSITERVTPVSEQFNGPIGPDHNLIALTVCAVIGIVVVITTGIAFWTHRREARRRKDNLTVSNVTSLFNGSNGECALKLRLSLTSRLEDPLDVPQIPMANLEIEKLLLRKERYAAVWKATASNLRNAEKALTVAVKTVLDEGSAPQKEALCREKKIMALFGRHLNIVSLLAVVNGDVPVLVFEYCPYGSLLRYLISHSSDLLYRHVDCEGNILEFTQADCTRIRNLTTKSKAAVVASGGTEELDDSVLSTQDLVHFSFQVARGMEYLADRSIVHRDLAARNVMVCPDKIVKISDFGLAVKESESVNISEIPEMPMKWMAPESMEKGAFSQKSDVWSFGVLMWEIFSYGEEPYRNTEIYAGSVDELKEWLCAGHRMSRTDGCPEEMFAVMARCWRYNPEDRSTFCEIRRLLLTHTDHKDADYYLSLDEEYQRNNDECH